MGQSKEELYQLIREKAIYKQDVFDNTKKVFQMFKVALEECVQEICSNCGVNDSRVEFYYKEQGEFQVEVKIASDILVFFMHTNVFQLDQNNNVWQSSYLKNDSNLGYVGIINVYNFLSDSYKYHRAQDLGYLIGRVFVNIEDHFYLQGKQQLGYMFNDFINATLDRGVIDSIVRSVIMYTLQFDLYTPPYDSLNEVTVAQIQAFGDHSKTATGKRLGFKFGLDSDIPE